MRTTLLLVMGLVGVFSVGCGGSTDDGGLNGTGAQAGTGGASGGSGGASGGSGGASGGAAGSTGGAGGVAGGSGGGGGAPECTEASQCKIFSDCCTCMALGPNEKEPPACPATCIQDACAALGVDPSDVACAAGSCVAGIQCGQASCFGVPPECDPGEVPSVVADCWGPCVPATQCAGVPSCAACTGPLQTCVMIETQTGDGPAAHCVDIPKGCEGTPTCECMGSMVCPQPFDTCTDFSGVKGMSCSCPNC